MCSTFLSCDIIVKRHFYPRHFDHDIFSVTFLMGAYAGSPTLIALLTESLLWSGAASKVYSPSILARSLLLHQASPALLLSALCCMCVCIYVCRGLHRFFRELL